MKKKSLIIMSIMFMMTFAINTAATAQRVIGVGLRLSPDGAGFTGKFFMNRAFNIELQANGSTGFYHGPHNAKYGSSMAVVGLLEYNIVFPDPSWRIYMGPGMHVGVWDRYTKQYDFYDNYRGSEAIVGIDAIFGVEYMFKSIPLGLSADMKPAMNFANEVGFFPNNTVGVSARFYFGNRMAHKPMPAERKM